ncbi:MAG: hypothetical protein WCX82_00250 [archaeon]|jgi:hypothetical protein
MVKKTENNLKKFGAIAFIIGVVIALIAGLLSQMVGNTITTSVLVLLGLIVGFLNVTDTEVKDYLLTAVSLVIVTTFGTVAFSNVMYIGPYLISVLSAITTFVVPATIIVALKEIYNLAKN